MSWLLKVAAYLFDWVTTARNYLFDKNILSIYRSSLPVISVGNVTVGGTGKTPLTLHIAAELKKMGRHPVVLSRGYGGLEKGPRLVDPSAIGATAIFGDEPVMIAGTANIQVVVARSRVAGAKLIEQQQLGDIILLDDGFQHRWLHRDVDVVCVDCSSDESIAQFQKRFLLPAGLFRENLLRCRSRISLICFSLRRSVDNADLRTKMIVDQFLDLKGIPYVISGFSSMSVTNQNGDVLSPTTVTSLTAIANPAGVIQSLISLGFLISERLVFPDHHIFTAAEIDHLHTVADSSVIVTTAKDAVRLPPDLRAKVWVVGGTLAVEPKAGLTQVLDQAIRLKKEIPNTLSR